MSLLSRLVGRLWKLPPAVTRDVASEAIRIPMRDGVELAADRYYPRRSDGPPAVLIRSCYGRRFLKLIALLFAERGMQVVVESCRGTAGSQGTFRPFFDEKNDGEDTVLWMERQPWFTGGLALWGISYLGNTAWAIANSSVADRVKAMGLHVTLTNFRDRTYAFGGFTLETCMGWTITMQNVIYTSGMNMLSAILSMRRAKALAQQAIGTIPLREADQVVDPDGVQWWQDWMDHAEPGDPWWDSIDYGAAAETLPPTVMTAGWYDIFLPFQLRDFVRARQAGRDVRIVIGPWMHAAAAGSAESIRQSIALFHQQFNIGSPRTNPTPRVRLFLMGANEWREYPSWPIPNAVNRTYYLGPIWMLSDKGTPKEERASPFDYDPSQPTPSFYGPALEGRRGTGDTWKLEQRSDVVFFTTFDALAEDLDVIGPISADIFLRSNTQYTDLYLCLCDVRKFDQSTNVCDGYVRLRPSADGREVRKVHVEFWPTAYRFQRGHHIRVIIASGAHPRYGRNFGSGESLGDAQTMVVAHQEILHGPEHLSSITLPICP